MKQPKITVIGSHMIDFTVHITKMPLEGETLEAPDYEFGFGGKGANQAIAAAKLGADVAMVAKLGDDLFTPGILKNFQEHSVDISHVTIAKGPSNGVAPIFVDDQGNNRILIVKGANNNLQPQDIDAAASSIAGSDFILLQLEIPLETVYYAIEWAKKQNIPVILNPAPAAPLEFERVKDAELIIPNEIELASLVNYEIHTIEEIKDAARQLVSVGPSKVIVTLGSKGALYVDAQEATLIDPIKVNPKDTAGAGDAFIGSFATFYAQGVPIKEAIKRANNYAGLSTLSTGTQKAFYSKEQWEKERQF